MFENILCAQVIYDIYCDITLVLFSLLSVISICLTSLSLGSFCNYVLCLIKKRVIRARLQQSHTSDVEQHYNLNRHNEVEDLRNESLLQLYVYSL